MTDSDKRMKVMGGILDTLQDSMMNIFSRWTDEKGYEDFKDYEKFMKDCVQGFYGDKLVFIKGTQRPFGFLMQLEGFPFKVQIYINSREYGWKSVTK